MTRILIVDDQAGDPSLLRALLASHGFRVDEAQAGGEAVASRPLPPPGSGEPGSLRQHNETLVRKLEEQMRELQRMNLALAEDVRLRQGAEAALREQKEFLDAIIANEPECVKLIDPAGRLLRMNPAGLAMLELDSLAEAQQVDLLSFLPPDQPELPATYRSFLQRVCAGAHATLVYPIIGRRGTRRWLESHAAPLHDGRRGQTLMLSITRDITERLRLEEQLRQAQKLEALGRLVGGIAHDFNNQLTVIRGYGAMLLKDPDDVRGPAYLGHILSAAERSSGLVRQLLTFSRKSHAENLPVDLHQLIDETMAVLSRSISKKIRLERTFAADDARILGDADMLQNALLNLALNARDAMPDGGEIRFTTSLLEPGPDLRGDPHAACLCVRVSDTGHGMTPEVMSHLFEPFYSTKQPGAGTGLGLASVHGTISQHGGSISVDSQPGLGTTFHLILPRLPDGVAAGGATPTAASTPVEAGHRILVIDDEPLVASLVMDALTTSGYQVDCRTDPVQAIEHFRLHWRAIDLVIVDLNMPGMHGSEVFTALRAIDPQARILLASGFSDEAGIADLLRQGACGLLAKPFLLDELALRVAQHVG